MPPTPARTGPRPPEPRPGQDREGRGPQPSQTTTFDASTHAHTDGPGGLSSQQAMAGNSPVSTNSRTGTQL